MDVSTITLDKSIKKKLDSRKVHTKESYNDVIKRLLSYESYSTFSETIEILSSPEIMESLAKSMRQMKSNKMRTYSLDKV